MHLLTLSAQDFNWLQRLVAHALTQATSTTWRILEDIKLNIKIMQIAINMYHFFSVWIPLALLRHSITLWGSWLTSAKLSPWPLGRWSLCGCFSRLDNAFFSISFVTSLFSSTRDLASLIDISAQSLHSWRTLSSLISTEVASLMLLTTFCLTSSMVIDLDCPLLWGRTEV